jgi:murein DD-endopeptidase MepM/ murein hydrolase activator NlpD
MALFGSTARAGLKERVCEFFQPRDLFFHDGKTMRRVHLSSKVQIASAAGVAFAALGGTAGAAVAAIDLAPTSSTIDPNDDGGMSSSAMEAKVEAMKEEVEAIRQDAKTHAEQLQKKQAFIDSIATGNADIQKLSALLPAGNLNFDARSADIRAEFKGIEQEQSAAVAALLQTTEAQYKQRLAALSNLGVDIAKLEAGIEQGGMGGPYEPVTAQDVEASKKASTQSADPQFRALFNNWKKLDQLEQSLIAIPSAKPVQSVSVNSNFGIRSDPFRGGAAMHSGVDIPGPVGTPIYATADGIVGRSGWVSGYGKLIELEHGKGIQTRYGHLSQINVPAGTKIKRGQLIGLMGSTGRSTGSHLHYEVRLEGRAVNPMPFLRSTDYLLAVQRRTQETTALGGPTKAE